MNSLFPDQDTINTTKLKLIVKQAKATQTLLENGVGEWEKEGRRDEKLFPPCLLH